MRLRCAIILVVGGVSFGRVWCLVNSKSTLVRCGVDVLEPTNQIAKARLSSCNSAQPFILSDYYDLIVTVSVTLSID